VINKEEPTIFIIMTGWNDKYNRNLPFYFVINSSLAYFVFNRKSHIQVIQITGNLRGL
jgi:hypothetical protein